jgi:hypothetical protein
MTIRNFQHLQPPPSFSNLTDITVYARKLYDALFRVMQGKTQNVLEITLTAGVATTTVIDSRISIQSYIDFAPRTANAAAEKANGTMYILDANRASGSVVITHANNAQVDRNFFMVVIG